MLAGKILRGKISALPQRTANFFQKLQSRRRLAAWHSVSPVLLLLLALIAAPAAVQAQSFQGTLRGLVRDSGGNAMPAVSIALVNEETNSTRNTVTNEAGEYVLERVDPGKYKVSAWTNGFKKVDHPAVTIETQQQVALDLTLEVGDVTESVTVTDEVSLIETSTPSTGQVLSKQVLNDLPNSGRNPFMLSSIVPNVIPAGNPTFNRQQDQSGSSQISLAGGPVRGNNYLLDGVPITDLQNRAVIIPSIEAVQELKVQVNTYDAEAGRTGGGVFNVTGKSGTNDIHGSLFGFLRPSALQANNFFNNRRGIAKPDAPYKLYGGSVGGPVFLPSFGEGGPSFYDGRDRTFFWGAFEGYRMQTFLTETFTVPTALERTGNFSNTRDSRGNLISIIDPRTGSPFAGNIIPTNRLDPVGLNLINYFPAATGSGDALSGLNNYTATSTLSDRADQVTLKMDHAVSDTYKISGMYAHYGSREPVADFYSTIANPGGSLLFRTVHAVALNNIFTLSPTTVLSLRYGYNSFTDSPTTSSAGFSPASLGFASSFTEDIAFNKFPRINLSGAYGSTSQGALGSAAPSERRYYSHNALGSVSKLMGSHSVKIGGDYRRMSADFTQTGQASGEFSFTRAVTNNELASLLLGYLSSDSSLTNNAQIARPLATYTNYMAAYVHDDYRLSQKLTLNFGLRYEYEQGLMEKDDQLTVGFDPNVASPLQMPGLNLRGGLLYAGVNGNPRQQTQASRAKFGPRIGFAYAYDDKTTIRAGYGIFWAPPVFNFSITGLGALGFSSVTTAAVGAEGTLSNPFPNGLNQPTGNSLGLLTQLGDTVDYVDYNRKPAYVQQYSVDVQREMPGSVVLTLSYVGSRGTHLQIGGINDAVVKLNQLAPEYLQLGSALQQQVANPFFGIVQTGILSRPTVTRSQLLRPFPQFGDINVHGVSGGNSFYNSGTIKAQKRLSRGVTFLTSYTFSRMLDDVIGQANYFGSVPSFALNTYDLRREYALSSVDTPHRYLISGSYELPFGNGRRFFSESKLADKLLGGWQINAIGSFQSGFPLSIVQNTNNTRAFSGGQRPNAVSGVDAATDGAIGDRIDAYINPAAFATTAEFTFGNLARSIGVRTPSQQNWDIGVLKNTTLFESVRAQFRMEAINAFNTPVFRAPNTAFGNANFGRITSQANFARVMQISLRLNW